MKRFFAVCLILVLPVALPVFGQIDNIDREFEFARGLIDLEFADYAEEVVDEIVRYHPEVKKRAKLVKVEILVSLRKLEEAKELARSLPSKDPKALAARLALANAYYATGDRQAAQDVYTQFFKKYSARSLKDKDLRRFYQDAAYRYGKMQERVGNLEEALKGYENVLKADPEEQIERRLKSEMADLYIKLARDKEGKARKDDLKRAQKLCKDVLWGGTDLWFGNCINTLAHIKLLQGDKKGAKETILDYMEMLKKVNSQLEKDNISLDLSPMAGALFLLGELYQDEAQSLAKAGDEEKAIQRYGKALQQFATVFAKYGGSKWAGDAGEFVDGIKTTLEEDFGKQVNIDMGRYRMQAIKSRFAQANQAYIEKNYKKAKEEYLEALNAYPNTSETGKQLARLGVSFAHLGNNLAAEMLIEYICERYSGAPQAHLGSLMIGKYYFDKKDEDMYLKAYDDYLETFPEHENVPGVLFTLAVAQENAGNKERAEKYLQKLISDHSGSEYYLKALARRGWNAYGNANYEAASKAFRKYVEESAPGREKVRIQFALADALARMEKYNQARTEFSELVEWLTPEDDTYANSQEEVKENEETLDKAEYYVGYCLSRMEGPKERLPQIRQLSLRELDDYIEKYPDSPRAPKAYNIEGKVLLKMGKSEEAAEVYTRLSSEYPESEAGQDALYSLIKSASEIGQTNVVDNAFARMEKNVDTFSPTQFTRTGEIMMENGLHENASKAFQQVLDMGAEERKLLERALFGLGKSRYELGNYAKAVEFLNKLMEKYPDSAFFYDTKFLLGKAYLEQGSLDKARSALRDVFKYAQKDNLRKRADYQLGQIEREAGNTKKALAAFERIALLSNPDNTELKQILKDSYMTSIELYRELGQHEDVVDTCNRYLKDFPESEDVEKVRNIRQEAKLK